MDERLALDLGTIMIKIRRVENLTPSDSRYSVDEKPLESSKVNEKAKKALLTHSVRDASCLQFSSNQ